MRYTFAANTVSVVVLLADGARVDSMSTAIDSCAAPALARLRDEGGLHAVTTCFPSVTGPAYAPFLMGRFPGAIGLPGLRWYDRAHTACSFPDFSRSYVGYQMARLDTDLDPAAPTVFELSPTCLGALSVIGRGLRTRDRIGRLTFGSATRAAWTHFRGNVGGWLDIDRRVARSLARQIRERRPEFAFGALTGIDKASHAVGHEGALVREAMRIVDDTVAAIRADAEADGRWRDMHLWVTSDHGHSAVRNHDDLAASVERSGFRTISHPWVYRARGQVAVMVSGNAMAHLYLDLARPDRSFWPSLGRTWADFADALVDRPSVDLVILPQIDGAIVRAARRGHAVVSMTPGRLSYRCVGGDPLGIGRELDRVPLEAAYDATIETDYPDSVVQIAALATAPRSGDIILSAARDWDFRARYEPIRHVSSHGALHRDHMMVPLLMNRPYPKAPRRTTDVMPSALTALGRPVPPGLDGTSFV